MPSASNIIVGNNFNTPYVPPPIRRVAAYQYVVKVVCGTLAEKPLHPVVSRGCYTTAVNVYNRSTCDDAVIRRRLSVGLPGAASGPVSRMLASDLGPCRAMEVDCKDIMDMAPGDAHFVKGFLVLESNVPLDVVAVYTAAGLSGGKEVETLHTERVPEREFNPCGPFLLNLDTGSGSGWRARGPNDTIFLPAVDVPSPSNAWGAIPGASWIERPGASQAETQGMFTFERRFRLCCGFDPAWMDMRILADNSARVYLNGFLVDSHNTFANPPKHIVAANQNLFRAGENVLTVQATNLGGPTGLIAGGWIIAIRGDCDNPLTTAPIFLPGPIPQPTYDPVKLDPIFTPTDDGDDAA